MTIDNEYDAVDEETASEEEPKVYLSVMVREMHRFNVCVEGSWCDDIRDIADMLEDGAYDLEYTTDMLGFAFDELIVCAEHDALSKAQANMAVALGEYSRVPLDKVPDVACPYIRATQLVAEALSMQAVTTWRPVDGEISKERFIALDDNDKEVVIGANIADLSPLLPEGIGPWPEV